MYSLPLGLALASGEECAGNFRTGPFSPPKPWKKIKRPLYGLLLSLALLISSTFVLTQLLLHKEKIKIQQAFSSLLTVENGETLQAPLSLNEIASKIEEMDQHILSRPDTFPLFPGIPKVSDILAWLSNHPTLNSTGLTPEIYIDRFHYVLEKRPSFNERTLHYQAKVEIDLATINASAARAFHEALLTPNPFVDSKKEIQWSSSKGKYFTSFYLKDKTRYQ